MANTRSAKQVAAPREALSSSVSAAAIAATAGTTETVLPAFEDADVGIKKPNPALDLSQFAADDVPTGDYAESLPTHKIADANDFVRLHPNEDNYWSGPLCFVEVPVKGGKGKKETALHLISNGLVKRLRGKKIKCCRLALAAKPYGAFFLCQVPCTNLDNAYNRDAVQACEMAKTQWVQVASKKADGGEGYFIEPAHDDDAFGEPEWGAQAELILLITETFRGRAIMKDTDAAWYRLTGRRQVIEGSGDDE